MSSKVAELLGKEIVLGKNTKSVALITIFAVMTFLAALVRIHLPFTPVPMTLQTLVLFFAVYFLDSKEMGLAQSIYVIAGMIGIPVFAAGIAGVVALTGPTAGYLLGFVIAGILMVQMKNRMKRSFISMSIIFAAGTVVIYTLGAMHLHFIYKLPISHVLAMGVIPFIIGDFAKILLAASMFKLNK